MQWISLTKHTLHAKLSTIYNVYIQPQRGVKKIRTNRKQLSIQRNILPKQPMVAVLRPSMGRQPLPFSVCPPVNLFNVPNNGVRLQPRVATTTGTAFVHWVSCILCNRICIVLQVVLPMKLKNHLFMVQRNYNV